MKPERRRQSRPKCLASNRLALARDLIQRNRRKASLDVLASQLASGPANADPVGAEAKVATLLGDYERKRGHFSEAADYFAVACKKVPAEDAREWFRPALGQLRAIIAQPDVESALALGQNILAQAREKAARFEEATHSSLETISLGGQVVIGARPFRPSVVAFRLGEAFTQAGEWEYAELFYREALIINPNGASRARQALAKIALAADRPAEGEVRARESLLLGKYRAKTLSAWPLLIQARARQRKPLLTPEDRAGLRAISEPSVRARAVLVLCKAMRPHGSEWMDLATSWIKAEGGAFPAIRFELEKLFRAEARLAGIVTRDQAAIALRHARTANAAPAEAIAAGKAYVRTLLKTGAAKTQWELVSTHLTRRYGPRVAARSIHAMALGAMEANRHDLAATMLAEIRRSLPSTRAQWMRSTWALARMEAVLGNYAAVYAAYSEIAQNPAAPARFRAQALLRALRAAETAKLQVDPKTATWLASLIETEKDHRVLLDLGRQLNIAGPSFKALRDQAATTATALASAKLAEARHPATALAILLELNRRQYYDLGRAADVVRQFETYAAPRLDWLWSPRSTFWEWYGVVVLSAGRVQGVDPAMHLAKRYLDDEGTPAEGLGILATETGAMLVHASRAHEAMPLFARAIQACPESSSVGPAHYWTALHALAIGDTASAKHHADKVRRCYKLRPALAEEWRYDAQALLILKDQDLNAAQIEAGTRYTPEFMEKQLAKLRAELSRITT